MNAHAKSIADRYVSRDGGAPVVTEAQPVVSLVHVANDNGGPALDEPAVPTPFDTIRQEVEDLLVEARNWADGEPIANQAQADTVTVLHDALHDAGKRAEEARTTEKKPYDEIIAEIQSRWNTLTGNTKTTGKGKVVLGKEALQAVLTPWRNKVESEKRAEAKRLADEAEAARVAATEAIRASRGNLEEREKAEELYQAAQDIERVAKRADKAATTKTGLRSVWTATLVDEETATDWAYGYAPEQFTALVQSIADKAVFGGLRSVPGFVVKEDRVAR